MGAPSTVEQKQLDELHIALVGTAWRRSKLLPCAFTSRCFCSTPSVLRSKTLPQAEFTSAEDVKSMRGAQQNAPPFCGECKSSWTNCILLWWASWRRSELPPRKQKLRGGRKVTSFCSAGENGSPRPVTSVTGLAMTPQKFTLSFPNQCAHPVRAAVPLSGADAPAARPAPAAQHYVGRGPRAPPHAAFPGRDDVGIVPCETMTRNVAHNTADAKRIPAASGQRGPA